MRSLLDALQAFNRTERHILVGWVLDRSTFPLGHEFRDALSNAIGVDVPADSYVAMDYRLNWLCAALMWSEGEVDEETPRLYDPDEGVELADNSDSDLVVAFAHGPKTHVVLLEAKGFMKWDIIQLKKKSARLQSIFGKSGDRFQEVVLDWVFVSPGSRPALELPQWMLDPRTDMSRHLPLPQPASHKFALNRCNSDGRRMKGGGYWKIRPDSWPGPSQ